MLATDLRREEQMQKLDSAIRKAWREHPDQEVDLIVHYSGDLSEISAVLSRRGVQVKRQFGLTHTISLRCSAHVALGLLKEPWVTRVEADRPVKALRR